MDRTVDISGRPTRVFLYVFASFLVFGVLFVGSRPVTRALTRLGVGLSPPSGLPAVVLFAALWLLLAAVWIRRVRPADGDWWGPVPREQSLGRFAGHGGLARHSRERAIDQLPDDEED